MIKQLLWLIVREMYNSLGSESREYRLVVVV